MVEEKQQTKTSRDENKRIIAGLEALLNYRLERLRAAQEAGEDAHQYAAEYLQTEKESGEFLSAPKIEDYRKKYNQIIKRLNTSR